MYKLCESSSGYCIRFKIYVGTDKIPGTDIPASESVVLEVAQPILKKGYTLYMDHWYSSPQLFITGTGYECSWNCAKKLKKNICQKS